MSSRIICLALLNKSNEECLCLQVHNMKQIQAVYQKSKVLLSQLKVTLSLVFASAYVMKAKIYKVKNNAIVNLYKNKSVEKTF